LLTKNQLFVKRLFDLIFAVLLLPILILPLIILLVASTIDTGLFGIFYQQRIGQHGDRFTMYKLRTLKNEPHFLGHLDKSASGFGKLLRKTKLDEFPQIINVLKGDMGFVGPRPDVSGFADLLTGEDRIVLQVKPGITGPATIKYRDEEKLLRTHEDPEIFNQEVIWPDKVEINKKYVQNWSFSLDLRLLIKSIF
jgi:lipopolysaccharide/colanic/teichoic acid biosynthesis glycosyltransferase